MKLLLPKLLSKFFFRVNYRSYLGNRKNNLFNHYSSSVIRNLYRDGQSNGKKLIIATQVGRGGGKWLCDILNSHNSISAYGERNRLIESKYRFYTSYKRVSNYKFFFDLLKSEALTDWENNEYSYISSPYFSHGLGGVYENLKPEKIVVLINLGFKVAVSLYNKGWYIEDVDLVSNQENEFIPQQFANAENHYYGRYIRLNIGLDEFNSLTRLGKIAVYMSSSIEAIASCLKNIPKNKVYLFELNKHDQNFNSYKQMMSKLGLIPELSERNFLSLKKRTSGSFENVTPEFTKLEMEEYRKFIKPYEKISQDLINLYTN